VTCKDVASFILEYLENELDEATRERFEQHLSICPNCVRYLAHYRATITAGREAFQEPSGTLPPEVPEDLVRAILAARAR
jgi:anti-sigma factor RsiW